MLFLLDTCMLCVDASYSHWQDRLLDVYDIQLLVFGHLVCIKVDESELYFVVTVSNVSLTRLRRQG